MSIFFPANTDHTLILPSFFSASPSKPVHLCAFVKSSAFPLSGFHRGMILKARNSGETNYFRIFSFSSSGLGGVGCEEAGTISNRRTSETFDGNDVSGQWKPIVASFNSGSERVLYTVQNDLLVKNVSDAIGNSFSNVLDLELSGTWEEDRYVSNLSIYEGELTEAEIVEFLGSGSISGKTPTALWEALTDWGSGDITDSSGNGNDITPPSSWSYSADNPPFTPVIVDLAIQSADNPAEGQTATATLVNVDSAPTAVRLEGVSIPFSYDSETLTVSYTAPLLANNNAATLEVDAGGETATATVVYTNTYPYTHTPGVVDDDSIIPSSSFGTTQLVELKVVQQPDPLVCSVRWDVYDEDNFFGPLNDFLIIPDGVDNASTAVEIGYHVTETGESGTFLRTIQVGEVDPPVDVGRITRRNLTRRALTRRSLTARP